MPVKAVKGLIKGTFVPQEYVTAIVSLPALVAALCDYSNQRRVQRRAQAHDNIQAEVDKFKYDTAANMDYVDEVRRRVGRELVWLDVHKDPGIFTRETRLSPNQDAVSHLWNHVTGRFRAWERAPQPPKHFQGMLPSEFTPEQYAEARARVRRYNRAIARAIQTKDEKALESGDWGLYDWRRLSPEEQEKIKELSKEEISGILELVEGVSIIKMTEKEPEITKPLEEVRLRIKSILEDQKSRQIAEDRISRLEKRARKEKSLETAAQKTGFEFKKTGLLKESESFEDIDTSGAISQSLFALEEKQISSLINTFKGVGVAQLEKIEPPRQANLEEVKDDVQEDFTAVKKKEIALEKIEKIKAELKRGSLEDLAEKYDAEYKTVNEHKRGQYLGIIGENQEFDKLAFSLSLKEASEPVEFENGYSLARVLDRKEVTKEDFEKNREKERENLLETKRNKFFQTYYLKLQE